ASGDASGSPRSGMSRFASAPWPLKAAYVTALALSAAAVMAAMAAFVALAGLHRLSNHLQPSQVIRWFWYFRHDPQVARWLKAGGVTALVFALAGLAAGARSLAAPAAAPSGAPAPRPQRRHRHRGPLGEPLGQELRQGRIGDAFSLNEERRLRGGLERVQRPERPPRSLRCRPERQHQLPCLRVGRALRQGVHVPNLIA